MSDHCIANLAAIGGTSTERGARRSVELELGQVVLARLPPASRAAASLTITTSSRTRTSMSVARKQR